MQCKKCPCGALFNIFSKIQALSRQGESACSSPTPECWAHPQCARGGGPTLRCVPGSLAYYTYRPHIKACIDQPPPPPPRKVRHREGVLLLPPGPPQQKKQKHKKTSLRGFIQHLFKNVWAPLAPRACVFLLFLSRGPEANIRHSDPSRSYRSLSSSESCNLFSEANIRHSGAPLLL